MWWFFKGRKKVGLALGSGGARGLAHIGVIKTLVKNNIPIDYISGSSSGALFGGLYAFYKDIYELEKIAEEVDYKDVANLLFEPNWGGGLVKGNKTIEYLKRYFSDKKIEDLKIPFSVVATDIVTAEPVIIKDGGIAEAVRASMSIPLVFTPMVYKGHQLVDGGVSSPVPVEAVKDMGADVVIAVNLDGVYFSRGNRKIEKINSTIGILKDSYYALRYNLAKKEVRAADILIEPEMDFVVDFDFIAGRKAISAGEKSTEREIGKIKRLVS